MRTSFARRPLFAVLLALALLVAPASAGAAAPPIESGNGITVQKVKDISSRSFDVTITTPAVSGMAVPFGNRMRITLPADYATSGKRYPVLYLMHFLGGSYGSWDVMVGSERTTAGADVITVSPEGGFGWYTNWVRQTNGAQNWETFHLDQLIPFIDRNLRTIATREGRGIAGISMGGFGAFHYAQKRPDLFTSVTSISGVLELNAPTQAVIAGSSMVDLGGPFAAFGSPIPGQNAGWLAADPVRHAAQMRDMDIQFYVGNNPLDPVEGVVRIANTQMARALKREGIPYTHVNYGLGASIKAPLCFGIHQPGCWGPAFKVAFPRILNRLAPAVVAS